MLSEELNIDYDDQINLEIEGETEWRVEQQNVGMWEWEQNKCCVGGSEDMTMGNDAWGERMPPNKAIGPSKR
jgi:hypothetical protein